MTYPTTRAVLLVATLGMSAAATAAQIRLSLEELQQFRLDQIDSQGDSLGGSPLDQAVAEKLGLQLSDSVQLAGDTLIVEQQLAEQVLDDGCNGSKLRRASLSVTLPPQSELGFDYSSVLKPIRIAVSTRASIVASGSAVQYFGIGNKSNCTRLGSDNFDFTVRGELDIRLRLSLDPQAELREDSLLRLSPEIRVELDVGERNFSVDVDSTVLKSLLKDEIEDALRDSLTTDGLKQGAERVERSLQRRSDSALQDGTLDVELPAVDNKLSAQLRAWIGDSAGFPLSDNYLDQNGRAIVNAALLGDTDTLENLLGSLLACQLGSLYLEDLRHEPLYAISNGACAATAALDTALFADPQCQQAVSVREQSLSEFCLISTDKSKLGDGASSGAEVTEWLLAPGTRLGITIPTFEDETRQPYQGSVNFRQFSTDRGTCSLEMRVYTPQPGATNLRPVLAFHGGSWSQRGAGFLGMESLMAHFSSQGMVVFAPFYRLAGDQDGPAACRQFVAEDILSDATAALDWVQANGADYDAREGKVGLFGQSAGGFLATWVAVQRAEAIDAALLMYPPTDVGGFVDDLNTGVYSDQRGVGILERFLGVERADWASADQQSRLTALSLAEQVAAGAAAPAVRIIHGLADDLVLPNQSERLCDALQGGRAETVDLGRLKRRACGEDGQLDLIEGAEHALEVCALGADCLAGDLLSASAAQASLREAYAWLAQDREAGASTGEGADAADDSETQEGDTSSGESSSDGSGTGQSGSGGGGALGCLSLLLLAAVRSRKMQRPCSPSE